MTMPRAFARRTMVSILSAGTVRSLVCSVCHHNRLACGRPGDKEYRARAPPIQRVRAACGGTMEEIHAQRGAPAMSETETHGSRTSVPAPGRSTRQRAAVSALLAEVDDFQSAQQLHDRLKHRGDSVGLTTVYRTLQSLADAGAVDVVRTDDGEAVYRRWP